MTRQWTDIDTLAARLAKRAEEKTAEREAEREAAVKQLHDGECDGK